MVPLLSSADPEDVGLRAADESAGFAVFALAPVCRFVIALARVVASIRLTVPFAFVT
jgi:hypothetical protein